MHRQNTKIVEIDNSNLKNLEESRFNKLVTHYGNEVKAVVHSLLEQYTNDAFIEFMEGRTGIEVPRESDGKIIIDYRNGFREVKQLMVDTMSLQNFQVPRNRAGGFKHPILQRMSNRAGKFANLAKELFINGVSTRKVRRAFEKAGVKISGLSKSSVDRITRELMTEYMAWVNRPLKKTFDYLFIDALYIKARENGGVRAGTIVFVGMGSDGYKETLHFTLGSEKEVNFSEALQFMAKRGLNLKAIKSVIVDGAGGLLNSIIDNFGDYKIQRCTVHKMENILNCCPKNLRPELKAKLNRLWNQSSKIDARRFYKQICDEYSLIAEKAIECLTKDIDSLLKFYDFPESHWKAIRTTNIIERLNREIKRRTKPMGILDTKDGIFRIVMGVIREYQTTWDSRCHWGFKK